VRELTASVNERVLARLDLDRAAARRVAPARVVGLLRALDVAGEPEPARQVFDRQSVADAYLARRGIDAGRAREDLAAEQTVNARGVEPVVVAEEARGGDSQ
jgi:hypothetical protein